MATTIILLAFFPVQQPERALSFMSGLLLDGTMNILAIQNGSFLTLLSHILKGISCLLRSSAKVIEHTDA